MIFSFLLPKMQGPQKGDALSPRPTNCILRTRSNEENAANTGLVVAPGWGARPDVAKRRSSPGAGQEQVSGGLRRADRNAAESRISAARGGNLPKVNYSESWARSDNPVFVFSSLLTQHQFGERNFLIGPLNRPDFLNNFQSQLTADQTLYDAGQTRRGVRSAELAKDLTKEE